jgi:feruloyl esterase
MGVRSRHAVVALLVAGVFGVARPESASSGGGRLACPELRSLTGYDFSITSARSVAAGNDAPAHCRVTGQVLPEIRFEVSLPASWNRRFYMFGNGGYAGEAFEAAGRVAQRNRALALGYAVASTDTGHDAASEPLASFATNRQKLLDYAFRAVHVTALAAKQVVEAHYGAPIERSYFVGCSTGGRQGLILAQRFPADFDGIVVGAPVLDFSGTMVFYTWFNRALGAAPIASGKLKILAEKIYAECDGKDGLADGLIDDPRRCAFSPARDLPRCPGDADGADCFTARQIGALERVYGGVTSAGKRYCPGLPAGAEVAGPGGRSGWEGWIVREGEPTISRSFAESFFRYMAFRDKNVEYDWTRFDFDADPTRLEWIHTVLDATDPDLSRFRERRGKILMYYGWADPALNPLMGVGYYEKVVEALGPSTTDFFRLFMVPGMFHCAGGVGCSSVDWVTALVDWVEKGNAPERIIGARIVDGKAVRKRPLCPYPQVARYKGSGSIDEAESFACARP